MKIVVAVILAVLANGCVVLPLPQAGRFLDLVDPATGQVAIQWDWSQDQVCGKMVNAVGSIMVSGQRLPIMCSNASLADKLQVKAIVRASNYPYPMQLAFQSMELCTQMTTDKAIMGQVETIEACRLR